MLILYHPLSSPYRRNGGNSFNWGYNDLVWVTSLLLSVLAFLEWNPDRLIHLFSLQPPLTCPTCVFLAVCPSWKAQGFTSFCTYRIHLSESHQHYIELHRLTWVSFHDLRPFSGWLQERSDRVKIVASLDKNLLESSNSNTILPPSLNMQSVCSVLWAAWGHMNCVLYCFLCRLGLRRTACQTTVLQTWGSMGNCCSLGKNFQLHSLESVIVSAFFQLWGSKLTS